MAIRDWPQLERPREKLMERGAHALSDAELLAIFLRTGVRGSSAVDLARDMLRQFGGLRALLGADAIQFISTRGAGPAKYVQMQAALELGRRYLECAVRREGPLTSPGATRDYLKSRLCGYDREVFACLFLDNGHRVLTFKELFFGSIDAASVHPREVVKAALATNAAAVIFAHNHPSGVAEPSAADEHLTRRLKEALLLVEIRVLDHFVIGEGEPVSFAERGLL